MTPNEMKVGLHVRVVKFKKTDSGLMVHPKHLDVRKVGATGSVLGPIPGHGGDDWWVQHDDNKDEIGAYTCDGLEKCPKKKKRLQNP